MRDLTAIDICAGAGGWACAARGLPLRVIAAVDLDARALLTYAYNHAGVECIHADVRTWDFARFAGRVDLVLGGIPCETVSRMRAKHPPVAAEMDGWKATVAACLAAVQTIKPRWWCYEDVEQIIPHLPAGTPVRCLDSSAWSAQRRVRAYVGRYPMPAPGTGRRVLRDCLRPGPHRLAVQNIHAEPCRSNTLASGKFYPWRPERPAPAVMNMSSRRDHMFAVVDGDLRRQVEWQEAAALQGFPEDYVFIGPPGYVTKLIGQAVQIDTARAILAAICAASVQSAIRNPQSAIPEAPHA